MSEWEWYIDGDVPPTPPPSPQTITLEPARVSAFGGGIDTYLASEDRPTGLTTKVFRGTNFRTPVSTLTEDKAREGQIRLSDPGYGSLTIQNKSAEKDYVLCDDVIRVELDGRAIHQWVVTEQSRATIRESAADQDTIHSGPGTLGLWSEAVVFPSLGVGRRPVERDRVWSWRSPSPIFDDSAWGTAVSLGTVIHAQTNWPILPFAENWPVDAGYVDVIGPGSIDNAPSGYWYFRQDITISTAGQYGMWAVIDNIGTVYVDGVAQLEITPDKQWQDATYFEVELSAGNHTISGVIYNVPLLPPDEAFGGPTCLSFVGYKLDANGEIFNVFPDFYSLAANAVVSNYPAAPPGMTAGEVLIGLLDEWQGLGLMLGWDVTFTEQVDSNGAAWPISEFATKVGTDGRTFLLDELAQTYIDVRAHNGGLVLDATIIDTMGSNRALELETPTDRDPASGNLLELTHDRTAPRGSSALVLWQNGWSYVDTGTTGRKKAVLLGLGAQPSEYTANQVATRELQRFRLVQDAITAGFRPRSVDERPDNSAEVGDRITVPRWDGTSDYERVMSWTFSEDEHGTISWAPELINIKQQLADRQENAIKKMADGTVRGESRVAQPVNTIILPDASQCCAPTPPVGT